MQVAVDKPPNKILTHKLKILLFNLKKITQNKYKVAFDREQIYSKYNI